MTAPRIIPRAEHPISRGYIDPDALRVLYRLHRSGYKGYLVGGSVRDLMTGRTPKDFDVGTDAKPNEVKRLFRNCRVIGRRFRLAHILFEGGKVVEVSTFRRRPDVAEPAEPAGGAEGTEDQDLLIRSDNTFGTPEEDALRRDFTINGLFYDIADFSVIDWVGGVPDLDRRIIRTIGDPWIRFKEDPVRMLRACEFAARLSFEIEAETAQALRETRAEIRRSAAPRVTEELLDPLRRGWGDPTYRLWSQVGLLDALLPELDREIRDGGGPARTLFWKMLAEADRRKGAGERLDDAALLGIVFLPLLFAAIRGGASGPRPMEPQRLLLVLEEVVNPIALRMSLPNHTLHLLKQALYTMGRLVETRPSEVSVRRLLPKPYFPPAVDLLSLYVTASGRYVEAASAWRTFLERSVGAPARGAEEPADEPDAGPPGDGESAGAAGGAPSAGGRRPRRRRRRGPAPAPARMEA